MGGRSSEGWIHQCTSSYNALFILISFNFNYFCDFDASNLSTITALNKIILCVTMNLNWFVNITQHFYMNSEA